jgi:hypothetical protein
MLDQLRAESFDVRDEDVVGGAAVASKKVGLGVSSSGPDIRLPRLRQAKRRST